jgi:hypothetical protein
MLTDFLQILPEVVASHSPHTPYHPGSPWGDGLISSNPTVGDMHQWNVWHGTQEKYQIYDTLGGRFNSEFGLEAHPHIDTIKHYVTDPAELYAQSHMIDFHNKADGHERRIATYLVENFRITDPSLEAYIHLSQLSQSDALMYGYRGWRQQWGHAVSTSSSAPYQKPVTAVVRSCGNLTIVGPSHHGPSSITFSVKSQHIIPCEESWLQSLLPSSVRIMTGVSFTRDQLKQVPMNAGYLVTVQKK